MTTLISMLSLVLGAAVETGPTTGPTTQTAAAQDVPFLVQLFKSPFLIPIIVIVLFYVLMIRSKRNQDKSRQDMLGQLKKGDRIQTIGGILGTVLEAREDEVLVKVDESSNTKIRFARSAIHRVLDAAKAEKAEKTEKAAK